MSASAPEMCPNALRFSLAVLMLVGCAPWLTPPSERIRVAGTVRGDPGMVEIEVYERCSRRFVFFERCPGSLLGQTKIGKPGPYLVQISDDSREVSIVGFRGSVGRESACAVKTLSVEELAEPLELTLAEGPCPLQRASSPTSAGGYTSAGDGHAGHSH